MQIKKQFRDASRESFKKRWKRPIRQIHDWVNASHESQTNMCM